MECFSRELSVLKAGQWEDRVAVTRLAEFRCHNCPEGHYDSRLFNLLPCGAQALHRKAVDKTSRLNALDEVRIASAKWHEVCPQVRPRQCERALRACAGIRMTTRAFSFYVRRAVACVYCANLHACAQGRLHSHESRTGTEFRRNCYIKNVLLFEENSILLLPECFEASGVESVWGEVSQESQNKCKKKM